MKKINLVLLMLISFLLYGAIVNADELSSDDFGPIINDYIEEVKYFKTVTVLNNSAMLNNAGNYISSFTTEITEEEYNNFTSDEIDGQTYIDTSTKKLISRLEKSGNYYKYTAITEWHVIPTLRSYDSLGIGHFPSVTNHVTPHFTQEYKINNGSLQTQSAGWSVYTSTTGSAATFVIPSGNVTQLTQTFYVLVEKTNSSSTVVSQEAAASYGQALQTVSYQEARDFTIGTAGLNYRSASSKYSVTTVGTTWTGTW